MKLKADCRPIFIGSLPYTDSKEAIKIILENVKDILFWPQLPKSTFYENMYVQYTYNLPGINIDLKNKKIFADTKNLDKIEDFYSAILKNNLEKFKYEKKYFSGFYEFLENIEKLGNLNFIKGQVTGPISLGLQLTDENMKSLIYNDTFMELIVENLKMMIRWQENELKKISNNTIIFVDEPYLTMFGSAFLNLSREDAIKFIKEVQSVISGLSGLHCCGNTDWSLVMDTNLDILSFDAYYYSHTISLFSEQLHKYIENGGIIAWGIVPSNEEIIKKESVSSLISKFDEILNNLENKGFDREVIMKSSLISPSCGLSTLSIQGAEDVIKKTIEISRILNNR